MNVVQKLVYLIRQQVITLTQVAERYREPVAVALESKPTE